MTIKNYSKNYLFFFFLIFKSIEIVFPQLLNNIIRLGDSKFKYSHFNFNSDGDMIIDIESYPRLEERRFFGLKKNGHFYFTKSNNQPFYSIYSSSNEARIEGESRLIKLTSKNSKFHGTELLCGISKGQDYYSELYNLNYNNMTKYKTGNMFGNIISDTFSFLESPDNSETKYEYIITYILQNDTSTYLIIRKMEFSFDNSNGYNLIKERSFKSGGRKIVSCFFTVNLKYICFY